MKTKHLIIIIGQSVMIILLAVYSFVQTVKAQAAERDALHQKEMAIAAQEEAKMQRIIADKNMEEAQRQNLRATVALEKLKRK